jgi:hypothetical protein
VTAEIVDNFCFIRLFPEENILVSPLSATPEESKTPIREVCAKTNMFCGAGV